MVSAPPETFPDAHTNGKSQMVQDPLSKPVTVHHKRFCTTNWRKNGYFSQACMAITYVYIQWSQCFSTLQIPYTQPESGLSSVAHSYPHEWQRQTIVPFRFSLEDSAYAVKETELRPVSPRKLCLFFCYFTIFPYILHIMCEGSMATASFINSAAFSLLPSPMFPRAIR